VDLNLLRSTLEELGQPRFRFDQVWKWTAEGAQGYHEMSNLPASLRAQLEERVPFSTLTEVTRAEASDGTVKLLLNTKDGRPIETVLMRYKDGRRSICVSSQSGCPLTCTFCATGAMKFGRNLTAWEILDQALHLRRIDELDHCVFMGMGEPMMNLDNVLEVCRRLPDVGITNRRTGISTVGWVPGIDKLTESDVPVRLAWSLHSAEDTLRSDIMPVNDRYSLQDVKAACDRFYEKRRKMIFVEYIMLGGVNDSVAQAKQLADLLEPWKYKINLIPYNPTDSVYDGSERGAMEAFRQTLEDEGFNATIRLIRGRDIDAACGQLAAKAAA
jgi:23S rRNA (adenine2503-C2)-methyltransferase